MSFFVWEKGNSTLKGDTVLDVFSKFNILYVDSSSIYTSKSFIENITNDSILENSSYSYDLYNQIGNLNINESFFINAGFVFNNNEINNNEIISF